MSINLFSLHGKTALVTGCNTGLGQAIAIGLAEAGANIVGINRSAPTETMEKITQLGRSFLDLRGDVSDLAQHSTWLNHSIEEFKHIDILVNNAGIIRRQDAIDFTESDWDEVMDVNLKAVFFLSQTIAKQFIKQNNGGKIINIASMLSYQGGIRVPSYTASKSAVLGLTRLMANEWAKYNINVNAIAPGYMVTNNTEQIRADSVRYNEILGRIPANRWGEASDISGPAVFLASEAAKYVHGFTLAVDGGWLAR